MRSPGSGKWCKLHAIFGGKNPHPNFLVGGAPPDLGEPDRLAATTPRRPRSISSRSGGRARSLRRCAPSSTRSTCPIRSRSPASTRTGARRGEGLGNFLTFGEFPAGQATTRQAPHPARRHPESQPRRRSSRSTCAIRHRCRSSSRIRGTTTPAARTADLHPLDRRDGAQLHRAESALRAARHREKLLLAEIAALAGSRRWRWAAGARPHAVCEGPRADTRLVDYTLKKLDLPVDRALFDPRTHRRAHARDQDHRRPMQGWFDALIANIKAGDTQTCRCVALGSRALARGGEGRRLHGGAAWRTVRTGLSSATAGSPTIRRWCRAPGMPARATRRDSRAPTRRRSSTATARRSQAAARDPAHHPHFDPCIACAVHVTDPEGKPRSRSR